jgi:hypothetical protein
MAMRGASSSISKPAEGAVSSIVHGGGKRRGTVTNRAQLWRLGPLCDPILDRVPIYRATHQVAAPHEAIEGYADIQFANIAPEAAGSS